MMVTICYSQTKKKIKSKKGIIYIVSKQELEAKENETQIKILQDRRIQPILDFETGTSVKENSIFRLEDIEVKPEFDGGNAALKKYLNSNIKIESELENIFGYVYIEFVVEKDGILTDFKILRDIGHGTKEEVIRVCKAMSKWKPAYHKGIPLRTLMTLRVEINIPKK